MPCELPGESGDIGGGLPAVDPCVPERMGLSAVGLSLLVPIVVYFTYVGPRLLGVKLIDSKTITLSRVHPNAAELIVRGAATPSRITAASPG